MPRQTVGKSSAGGGHERQKTRAAVTDGAVSFRQCARLPELPSFMGSVGDIFFFQHGAARGHTGRLVSPSPTRRPRAALVSEPENFPEGEISKNTMRMTAAAAAHNLWHTAEPAHPFSVRGRASMPLLPGTSSPAWLPRVRTRTAQYLMLPGVRLCSPTATSLQAYKVSFSRRGTRYPRDVAVQRLKLVDFVTRCIETLGLAASMRRQAPVL